MWLRLLFINYAYSMAVMAEERNIILCETNGNNHRRELENAREIVINRVI